MTSRSLGMLVLLATILFATHAALVASTYLEESPPFFLCKAIEVAVYALAAVVVLRDRDSSAPVRKRTIIFILATGVVLRAMFLGAPPDSTDINRYIWDGRVQAAGINPYLYIPADPALKFLRDDEIYPEINRAEYAPTIYPPFAQILFFLVTRVSESLIAMKTAMVLCEGLAVWAIMRLLAARGIAANRILLYAWHPLPIWEFAGSGHVDAAAIACVMLGLLAAEKDRRVLAGMALGGATLIKLFPILIGPALYRRWDWRLPLAGAATILVLYAPYIGAGKRIFGFLSGYSDEEGLRDGSGLYLWILVRHVLPASASASVLYMPVAALVLATTGLMVLFARKTAGASIGGALVLATIFTVLTSPHYPWYLAWLVPFLCFVMSWAVLYLTAMSTIIYLVNWPPDFIGGTLLYAPFFAILAIEVLVRARTARRARSLA